MGDDVIRKYVNARTAPSNIAFRLKQLNPMAGELCPRSNTQVHIDSLKHNNVRGDSLKSWDSLTVILQDRIRHLAQINPHFNCITLYLTQRTLDQQSRIIFVTLLTRNYQLIVPFCARRAKYQECTQSGVDKDVKPIRLRLTMTLRTKKDVL